MTELGQTIMPILVALGQWVKEHGPTLNGEVRRARTKGAPLQ
jgi:DNA-binding HxlR family transcriptional regulator